MKQYNYFENEENLINKEISGARFNEIYHDTKFVKLTNSIECHNGFQFSDGLNIDSIPFNPHGTCQYGGIYFVKKCAAYKWLTYGINVMRYIRKVTIPDDACVYIECDKFK